MPYDILANRTALVLALGLGLVMAAPAFAADDDPRCGPEIKKKQVTMLEVEARKPLSVLEELEAEKGMDFDVIVSEEVVVTSGKPQKKAQRLAADRGCPYLIVGEMRERPTGRMLEDRGRSAGNLPIYREEVHKVVEALFAVEAEPE